MYDSKTDKCEKCFFFNGRCAHHMKETKPDWTCSSFAELPEKCTCGGVPEMQYHAGSWRTYSMKCRNCGEELEPVCFESEAIRRWNKHVEWMKDFDDCL